MSSKLDNLTGHIFSCFTQNRNETLADDAHVSLLPSSLTSSGAWHQVAVQISTKTCGPCKVVYPHFAGLSEELPDVKFIKIMGDHDAVGNKSPSPQHHHHHVHA